MEKVAGRAVRIAFVPSESPAAPPPPAKADAPVTGDDAATKRALENPEVKSFQEQFPGSQIRTVRNLKE